MQQIRPPIQPLQPLQPTQPTPTIQHTQPIKPIPLPEYARSLFRLVSFMFSGSLLCYSELGPSEFPDSTPSYFSNRPCVNSRLYVLTRSACFRLSQHRQTTILNQMMNLNILVPCGSGAFTATKQAKSPRLCEPAWLPSPASTIEGPLMTSLFDMTPMRASYCWCVQTGTMIYANSPTQRRA